MLQQQWNGVSLPTGRAEAVVNLHLWMAMTSTADANLSRMHPSHMCCHIYQTCVDPNIVIDPPCAPSIGSCHRSAHRPGMRSLAAVLTRAAAAAVATDPFARFQGQPAYTMLHGFVNDGLVRSLDAQQHTAGDACILLILIAPQRARLRWPSAVKCTQLEPGPPLASTELHMGPCGNHIDLLPEQVSSRCLAIRMLFAMSLSGMYLSPQAASMSVLVNKHRLCRSSCTTSTRAP